MMHHQTRQVWLLVVATAVWSAIGLSCTPITTPEPNQNQDASHPEDTATEPASPSFETYFSRPAPGQPDTTIEDAIVDLLEQTPDDARVLAAFYTFGRQPLAEAFADARDRGVDVRVVLGNTSRHSDGSDWTAVEILRDRLDDRLTVCNDGEFDGGCMGENIHHNKFVAFSELEDGSEHVVLKTSANLTDLQLERYNNMVVVRDDQQLFSAFTSYWEDLRRDETDMSYNRIEEGEAEVTAYFFPHDEGDPVHDALDDVDCEAGADVRLAVAFFTNGRDALAERLRQMDRDGCDVGVVLRESSDIDSPGNAVLGRLESGDIEVGMFYEDEEIQLHSKYLAIEGVYGERDDAQVVWTGSHNYTVSALRYNDEVLIEIYDGDVYDAHRHDWNQLLDRAELIHP